MLRLTENGIKTFSYSFRLGGRTGRSTIGKYPQITIRDARQKTAEMKARNDARDEYHWNRPKGMQFGAPLPPEQVQHFRDQIGYTGLADWQK